MKHLWEKFHSAILHLTDYVETFLAILLLFALILSSARMVFPLVEMAVGGETIDLFSAYLGHIFSLIIGVEALKMLCKHSPGSALEVLLFTLARELVVTHSTQLENLMTILAIAIIFFVRKYLYVPTFNESPEEDDIGFGHFIRRRRKPKPGSASQTGVVPPEYREAMERELARQTGAHTPWQD